VDEKNIELKEELKKGEKKVTVKDKPLFAPKEEITFRENRKFDLHIGRNMITFKGRETKPVPIAWLDHKDFKMVEHLFVRKGA